MLLRRKTILWPAIPCCKKIDIRLVLISGDAMRRRDFSVQACQLINAPNSARSPRRRWRAQALIDTVLVTMHSGNKPTRLEAFGQAIKPLT